MPFHHLRGLTRFGHSRNGFPYWPQLSEQSQAGMLDYDQSQLDGAAKYFNDVHSHFSAHERPFFAGLGRGDRLFWHRIV
jgi:hypothetical protein